MLLSLFGVSGKLVRRISPEDVTINTEKDALIPECPIPGESDKEKFEKARKLKDYIGAIRAAYTWDITSEDGQKRQLAVATYLMDKLGLRAGTEKVDEDDDEADIVSCRRLKVENVKAISPILLAVRPCFTGIRLNFLWYCEFTL
ncbi:putative DNA topoisomerase [Rosa chinensis]|uniref:Putative DNA topoisomerase n=1 Tax=Rosa chinensis TaxID=74649 RepID=A0A2P6QXV2_ROSCH|nr:putative DNA topoisomerase [Rosa chinensis]